MFDENESEKGLSDYLDVIRRRKYYFILTFPLLALIAIGIALSLPPIYRSQGVILIETQEMPTDLVRTTVTSFAEQQIKVIQQRVLTTALIQEAIQKHNLYPELRQKASPTQLANEFRSNVSVDMVSARVLDPRGHARTANIAFTVAFYDPDPAKAQAVANDLVTTFLSENVRTRTERASETTAFIREEANRMRTRVQVLEDRIAQFKLEFSDSLPEMLNFNLSMIERGDERLLAIQNQQAQIADQLHLLSIQLSAIDQYLPAPLDTNQPMTPTQRLAMLQEELAQLRNRYSSSHPDVVRLMREIDLLQETTGESGTPGRVVNPQYWQINLQVESLQRDLVRLEQQRERVEQEVQVYRDRVIQTPQVQRGYEDLTRDYENELRKYNELRSKELEAEIAQNLESENRAESFVLLEPPLAPTDPVKPNRKKIALLGIMLAGGFGIGLMVLVEMLDGGIRGSRRLSSIIGSEPIITIPMIMTSKDYLLQRVQHVSYLIVALLIVIAGVAAVHIFVMSLDILWIKVMSRINLM